MICLLFSGRMKELMQLQDLDTANEYQPEGRRYWRIHARSSVSVHAVHLRVVEDSLLKYQYSGFGASIARLAVYVNLASGR